MKNRISAIVVLIIVVVLAAIGIIPEIRQRITTLRPHRRQLKQAVR